VADAELLREISERLTKLESALFTNNGKKGFIEKVEEFMSNWWGWHDKGRKETCYFLDEKEEIMKSKVEKRADIGTVIKYILAAITVIGFGLKLWGLI